MSLLSRIAAPEATHELAALVAALLSSPERPGWSGVPGFPAHIPDREEPAPAETPNARRLPSGPTGLGTSAARFPWPAVVDQPAVVRGAKPRIPRVPTGLGTSAVRVAAERPDDDASVPQLYCPGPVRDDPVLGEVVNERLVEWAEEVGIYPGQLDRVRAANFGRLIMLTHPDTDDPDRLLAAAKCALAEWSTDDHYVEDEALGADPKLLATRLALAHAVVDPPQLPVRYAPELERAAREDPVLVAYRSSLDNLGRYASGTQLSRLRCQMAVTFLAWNHEVAWRTEGRIPPVWEYLVHRHEDSFLPCMVLIDAVGGYELPPTEFDDQRVRRAFAMAGSAAVLVNDLYSMAKDQHAGGIDLNLPTVIAAEEKCSLDEAVKRSVEIHDELVQTFETEAFVLSLAGSPALRRFLAGVWAWLGGNREWHRTSPRYNSANHP